MPRLPAMRPGGEITCEGVRIPFTFWPEGLVLYGRLHASNCWQCIENFVKAARGVKPEVKQAAIAFLQQSHDLFEASLGAAFITKPLMLYYCYLNLVHAFLVYRQGSADLGKQIHGLQIGKAPRRYRGLTSVSFSVQQPRGARVFAVFNELRKECGFHTWKDGKTFKLSEMAYRMVGLHDAYTHLESKRRLFFPVRLAFKKDTDEKRLWTQGSADLATFTKEQRKQLGAFIDRCSDFRRVARPPDGERAIYFESIPQNYARLNGQAVRKCAVDPIRKHIWTEQTSSGFKYYLYCGSAAIPQVATNFASMFALGSIVRYQPSLARKLEGEWLVHEYLATQPMQFVYLLGSGLVRNEICPAPLIA